MADEISNKQSFANSAYAQIYRFDEVKRRAQRHAANCNNFLWNIELDNLWKELAADLKQKYGADSTEIKNIYTKMYDINKKILSTSPLITGSSGSGFNKTSDKRQEQINKQYDYLNDKEIFIGELQNDIGKGTKWADEDADSM